MAPREICVILLVCLVQIYHCGASSVEEGLAKGSGADVARNIGDDGHKGLEAGGGGISGAGEKDWENGELVKPIKSETDSVVKKVSIVVKKFKTVGGW
ncbi:jg12379 [Pararge aegeria aegeria]|uniref:Jg12379 protein n=1 Tax=Pararge aegeria aegeria TaxID=348720 RepID=A0A8S4S897_9NEOP|nr:jg12379 [Pararge aegeria aegeria]